MSVQDLQVIEARQRIAVAAGAALLVADVVLVMFVMPAEFAVDPLGTGARFGLLDLGITGQQVQALETEGATGAAGQGAILAEQERPFQQETVGLKIAPGQWVEYKYRLDKGEALLYSWKASGPINLDFHAEPDGGPRGYAQSYETKQAVTEESGTMTAPFAGIHGWYWQNTTDRAHIGDCRPPQPTRRAGGTSLGLPGRDRDRQQPRKLALHVKAQSALHR